MFCLGFKDNESTPTELGFRLERKYTLNVALLSPGQFGITDDENLKVLLETSRSTFVLE